MNLVRNNKLHIYTNNYSFSEFYYRFKDSNPSTKPNAKPIEEEMKGGE